MRGLCECGCGERTTIARYTDNTKGYVKGEPRRYVIGHNGRHRTGSRHPQWKGGRYISRGYVLLTMHGGAREHRVIAERAIGRPLPDGAVVHHANSGRADNANGNLVVCEDQPYHMLIEQRTRAYEACGHADWRICTHCKAYDAPENLSITKHGKVYHRTCRAAYERARRRAKTEGTAVAAHLDELLSRNVDPLEEGRPS